MGGAATKEYGTENVDQQDIDDALSKVSEILNVDFSSLPPALMGSTRLTYLGKQDKSGDIDLAFLDNSDRPHIIQKMNKAVGVKPHITAGNVYSYPLELEDKSIQIDFMFVIDMDWAKFAYHASEFSKYKSGVRNELISAVLKHTMVPGEDIRIYSPEGLEIAKCALSYNWSSGCERVFKLAPMRKDGTGRVKTLEKTTPEILQKFLDDNEINQKFKHEHELIVDPDKFANRLFLDQDIMAKDIMRAEQLIELIKERKDHEDIFKSAKDGLKRRGFDIPSEI